MLQLLGFRFYRIGVTFWITFFVMVMIMIVVVVPAMVIVFHEMHVQSNPVPVVEVTSTTEWA